MAVCMALFPTVSVVVVAVAVAVSALWERSRRVSASVSSRSTPPVHALLRSNNAINRQQRSWARVMYVCMYVCMGGWVGGMGRGMWDGGWGGMCGIEDLGVRFTSQMRRAEVGGGVKSRRSCRSLSPSVFMRVQHSIAMFCGSVSYLQGG